MVLNRKHLQRWIAILALLLLAVAGCAPRAVDYDQVGPRDKLVIRFSHVTSENSPKGLAAIRFKELVEFRSGGKVEVQVYPNSTLYSDKEEIEALGKGEIQIIAPAISKLSHLVPEVQVFDLPFLFTSQDDIWELAEGPVGQKLNELLEAKGFKVLAVWDNGFKQITNNHAQIQTPKDFENLSFRIMSSRVLARQFDSVGATSLVLPFDELYTALEKGQVNGEENTVSNIVSKRLYVTQKHMTKSDHGYLGYFVMTDKAFWESIPSDTRKILEETLQEVTEWERKLALDIDRQDYEYLKNRPDVQIYELSSEEKQAWKTAFYPTYEWFIEQIHEELIIDYIHEIFTGDN